MVKKSNSKRDINKLVPWFGIVISFFSLALTMFNYVQTKSINIGQREADELSAKLEVIEKDVNDLEDYKTQGLLNTEKNKAVDHKLSKKLISEVAAIDNNYEHNIDNKNKYAKQMKLSIKKNIKVVDRTIDYKMSKTISKKAHLSAASSFSSNATLPNTSAGDGFNRILSRYSNSELIMINTR